jgi:hypothetical protein
MTPHTARGILGICRYATAAVWLYQGLVPKLLGPHRDELAMVAAIGVPPEYQALVSQMAGAAEIVLALCIVFVRRHAWPHVVAVASLAMLLVFVALFAPAHLGAAFNPVAMNLPLMALSFVAIGLLRDAARDRRR